MPQSCEFTGIRPLTGHNVSHSNVKTAKRSDPNLQRKRYVLHELGGTVSVRLSTRAIRTIDKKGGLEAALADAKEEGLSLRLQRLRRRVLKARTQGKKNKVVAKAS